MKIRFYNARILTMRDEDDIFFGEVWIENERIIFVGDEAEQEMFYQNNNNAIMVWDHEIDCDGNVLMPGFKNAHTHSSMTVFRSMCDDLNLHDWLYQEIFPREAKITEEDCYHLVKLAILEYVTSGVTAIGDMYITPNATAKACDELGMRCMLVSGLNDHVSSVELMEKQYQTLNHAYPLVTYQMGVHAEYTCSKELLMEVAEMVQKYQTPIYTHMSETENEVANCIEKYGMTPIALFESLGLFDFGGSIYHGVYPTEKDLGILKKRNVTVVSNPASNLKLSSGIAPITQYLMDGISVAVGTDGASSNNCLDMFREMFLITGLAKLKEKDPSAVDAMNVLEMATKNGALSMKMEEADILATGKLADIIMIDLHQPNMQPINNIAKNIVYSGSKQNVKMTMVNGEILYYKGEFLCCNHVNDVYKKANEIRNRLVDIDKGSS